MRKGGEKNLHVKGWRRDAGDLSGRLTVYAVFLSSEKQNLNCKALVNNGCYSLSRFSPVGSEERKVVHADCVAVPSNHVYVGLRFASLHRCSIITQLVTTLIFQSLLSTANNFKYTLSSSLIE